MANDCRIRYHLMFHIDDVPSENLIEGVRGALSEAALLYGVADDHFIEACKLGREWLATQDFCAIRWNPNNSVLEWTVDASTAMFDVLRMCAVAHIAGSDYLLRSLSDESRRMVDAFLGAFSVEQIIDSLGRAVFEGSIFDGDDDVSEEDDDEIR